MNVVTEEKYETEEQRLRRPLEPWENIIVRELIERRILWRKIWKMLGKSSSIVPWIGGLYILLTQGGILEVLEWLK